MLTILKKHIESYFSQYCGKHICNDKLCGINSHSACQIKSINDSELTGSDFISFDDIYHSRGFQQLQGVKICDTILIKNSDNSILVVELSAPCKPIGRSYADYKKEFEDKIQGTILVIEDLYFRKCGKQMQGQGVKWEYKIVFSKPPVNLAAGQVLVNFVTTVFAKSLSVGNVNVKVPYSC